MNTLLMRLVGPIQSWGVQSRFGVRDTGREPSKSGVVGLLCAALGRPRSAPIEDIASLRMGVRVDVEGKLESEFQTMQSVTVNGEVKDTGISTRYYLTGAVFLVGLEGADAHFLQSLQAALQRPRWMLYLGRRAFPPAEPVWLPDGLRLGQSLEEVLFAYPWLGSGQNGETPPQRIRLVLDNPDGEQVRPDYPISFAERTFAPRRMHTTLIAIPDKSKEAG
jgi:CRISPR system Cascade subunit CasD